MDLAYTGGRTPWLSPLDDDELKNIAQRHGFQELYDQFAKSSASSKRTNTGVFFTNETMNSNSTNIHLNHSHTFCYLCSVNQHEHERTKPKDEAQRRKLIPYKNPKARLSLQPEQFVRTSPSSLDLISYRFTVRTGTEKDSGTRSHVFLYLYGTEKNWTSIHLQGSTKSTDGFPSGSIRTFCLKGPNIGQLHHLNVNLVGARSDKEWFLKEIEITNLNTSATWLCEFNCWLPKTDDQQMTPTKASVHHETKLSFINSVYILQIRTGEKPYNDTNANIQVRIRGSANQTYPLILTQTHSNLFQQNQLDTFAIIGPDLGDLLEISVEGDKNRIAMDWDIKDMILWKIIPKDDQKHVHLYFPFNICLNKKLNKFIAQKETYAFMDHSFKGPMCYHVMIKTGNASNGGTDANVFLILYGQNGRTAIHQLNNRFKNDFERNTISEFTIMDMDIGKIDRIKIWHDNSGPSSAWLLESVVIRKKLSTCHTVSNIYIQRVEQISQALYRQSQEKMRKNSSSYSNESHDRLGSSRSILRHSHIYDKANLRKKVTWDEQSIGSQDDLLSMDSQCLRSMSIIDEKKLEHQIYWISSHNYVNNKWTIKSIEETNSFDFDSSIRSLLLSDRSSVTPMNDETYEFQANCWLKKDGQLEVYLTPKSIHRSSDVNLDKKKYKHLITTSNRFDHQHDESSRSNSSTNKLPQSLSTMQQRSKLPHNVNDVTNPLTSEEELLARITTLSSSYQLQPTDRSSPLVNTHHLLTRSPNELPSYSRSGRTHSISSSSNERLDRHMNTHLKVPTSYHVSKAFQANNDLISSLPKPTPIESTVRSKSTIRSTPDLSMQNSVYDQVYHSAYGTVPSDDF